MNIPGGERLLSSFSVLSKQARVLVGGFTVAILLVLIQPIKNHAWNTILVLGDQALAERHFDQARLEYRKLRLIRWRSSKPQQLIDRANQAEHDITTLRPFYGDRGDNEMLQKLDQATKDYSAPEAATVQCQTLANEHEFDLALLCIQKTTATWPNYRDGWLTEQVIAQKLGKTGVADTAHQKALKLDPNTP